MLPATLSPEKSVQVRELWDATQFVVDPFKVGEFMPGSDVRAYSDVNSIIVRLRELPVALEDEFSAIPEVEDLIAEELELNLMVVNGFTGVLRRRRARRFFSKVLREANTHAIQEVHARMWASFFKAVKEKAKEPGE